MLKNKVFWGVAIAIVVVAIIWVKINWQMSQNYIKMATSTTEELILNNSGSDAAKNNNSTIPSNVTVEQTAKPIVSSVATFLRASQNAVGISYPIHSQVVYYIVTGKTLALNGYGYSFIEHSSSTTSTILGKIKGYLSNMTIDILNSGAPATGVTAYSDSKYICILFEKAVTANPRGDKEVNVKCANRPK